MANQVIAYGEPDPFAPHASPTPQAIEVIAGIVRDRRKILLAMLLTFAATAVVAALIVPDYTAQSTLLVLLSKDYAAQSEIGSERSVAGVLDRDAFLKAETDIIESEPLARQVVRQVGIARLFPRLVHPSLIRRLIAESTQRLRTVFDVPPEAAPSLEDIAVAAFARNLSATGDKAGNVITVSFRNPDRQVAAEAVNALVADYLGKRTGLYAEIESTYLAGQTTALGSELEYASRAYEDFKATHGIVDYPTQRDILLHQQADLVRDQNSAASRVAQLEQRLSVVSAQLAQLPPELIVFSETDSLHRQANLQTVLENLKLREAKLLEDYRPHSAIVAELEGQIRNAEAQLANARAGASVVRRGRNPVYDDLVLDRAHIGQDLQAVRAQNEQDTAQLAALGASLKALEANSVKLAFLERRRALVESDYRNVEHLLGSRRIVEGANAHTSNVRVIEPATPPLSRPHLRAAILIGGVMLGLLAGVVTALMCEVLRRGFLVAGKLERSLGLPVLAVIPELSDPVALSSISRKLAHARFG